MMEFVQKNIDNHPIITVIIAIVILILEGGIIYHKCRGVTIGDFKFDFSKAESVKGDTGKNSKDINEIKRQVEEKTRYIISRQFSLVRPYLQSLRPIFNRLMYSILDDAIIDSLGIEREKRIIKDTEEIPSIPNGRYLVEEVRTYKNVPQTRTFTNLVESSVDSLLSDLELEIYRMIVANNIGKCKEEVQQYVKSRSENLIGVIRNDLCNSYNQLSNKNLFDTHKYWAEAGITYPEDWIADKVYQLLKSCMTLRYSDFE